MLDTKAVSLIDHCHQGKASRRQPGTIKEHDGVLKSMRKVIHSYRYMGTVDVSCLVTAMAEGHRRNLMMCARMTERNYLCEIMSSLGYTISGDTTVDAMVDLRTDD